MSVAEDLAVTPEEREKYLAAAFSSLSPLKMKAYPMKYKRRLVALRQIAAELEPGRVYTQREINDLLEAIWQDPVTLRRDLIGEGMLKREKDGSAYWACPGNNAE